MKRVVFVGFFFLLVAFCSAQDVSNSLDSIKYSLINGDTSTAILHLENFERNYSNNFLLSYTNDLLGDLYDKTGKSTKSFEKRKKALDFRPTDFSYKGIDSNYIFLFDKRNYSTIRANACIKISEVYIKQSNMDSSLKYLKLADDKYLPYKDCVNGMLMYRSFLSFKFCDHYLHFGDTTNAIKRLFRYFLEVDGNAFAVTKKLKELLLKKYSQEQIELEVKKSIEKCKIIKDKYSEVKLIRFVMFNEKIYMRFDDSNGSPKNQLRTNKLVKLLVSA
jgi:tetratricopeptide (TPR) repeat protein